MATQKRKAYALLIDGGGPTVEGAQLACTKLRELIGSRFKGKYGNVTLLDATATREGFSDAMGKLAKQTKKHDLFVLGFAGHGYSHPGGEGWKLRSGDEISETRLASALVEFKHSEEVVIVSDCCYAAGIHTPGSEPDPNAIAHSPWQRGPDALARAVQGELARLRGPTTQPFPLIFAAAAAPFEVMDIGRVGVFTEALCQRVRVPAPSYVHLGHKLEVATENQVLLTWTVVGDSPATLALAPFRAKV